MIDRLSVHKCNPEYSHEAWLFNIYTNYKLQILWTVIGFAIKNQVTAFPNLASQYISYISQLYSHNIFLSKFGYTDKNYPGQKLPGQKPPGQPPPPPQT